MACCCCAGPGICCQGTTCTSVNACECEQSGGAFKAGRKCDEILRCVCSGQYPFETSVCEGCPPGCQEVVCACAVHQTINVSVEITENLAEWYCGSEENWNQLKDLIEGDFTLNFFPSGQLGNFGPCAGLWLYASDGGVFTFDSGVRIVGWNARSGRFGGSINIFTFGLSSYLPELRCGLNAVRRGSTSADYTEIEQDEGWPCTEIATRAGEALLDFYTWGDVHLIARGKLSIK